MQIDLAANSLFELQFLSTLPQMVLKRADTFGLFSYLCPLENTLHDIFSLLKLKNSMM